MPGTRALKRQEDQEFKVLLITTEILRLPWATREDVSTCPAYPSPRKNLNLGLEAYACKPFTASKAEARMANPRSLGS